MFLIRFRSVPQQLEREMMRADRNMKTVLNLMEKTFDGRQVEFGENRLHIANALKEYPALREISVVSFIPNINYFLVMLYFSLVILLISLRLCTNPL